jgi:hypothetical protein
MAKQAKDAVNWATHPLEDELGEALRAEVLGWPDVTHRQMMGTLAFFRRKQMLGCYINRALAKKKPRWMNRPGEPPMVWVRLGSEAAELARKRPCVTKCRLGFVGWIEVPLESRAMLEEAVRWLGHAMEHPPREESKGPSKKRKRSSK